MTISTLLTKLRQQPEIDIEERKLKDGTVVYIFFSTRPFPTFQPVWYPIVVRPGQVDVEWEEIEAMLRHLWQFQIDIGPGDN
jgi:hypothetical protein